MKNRALDMAVATQLGWTDIRERVQAPSSTSSGSARRSVGAPVLEGCPPPLLPSSPKETRLLPHYSEDERAAWLILEILKQDYNVEVSFWHDVGAYVASVRHPADGSCLAEASHPLSAATAICEAFLAILGKLPA